MESDFYSRGYFYYLGGSEGGRVGEGRGGVEGGYHDMLFSLYDTPPLIPMSYWIITDDNALNNIVQYNSLQDVPLWEGVGDNLNNEIICYASLGGRGITNIKIPLTKVTLMLFV